MMIVVDFSVSSLDDSAKTAVQQIRSYMVHYHPNLESYFTGETGLFQDMFSSIQQTISRTTLVTIILVAIFTAHHISVPDRNLTAANCYRVQFCRVIRDNWLFGTKRVLNFPL